MLYKFSRCLNNFRNTLQLRPVRRLNTQVTTSYRVLSALALSPSPLAGSETKFSAIKTTVPFMAYWISDHFIQYDLDRGSFCIKGGIVDKNILWVWFIYFFCFNKIMVFLLETFKEVGIWFNLNYFLHHKSK